jgi:hypothetical protein
LKLDYQAAARPSQSAFNVVFNDAYKGPELSKLNTDAFAGNPGEIITVRAIDNFFIDSVRISILDSTGAVLEEGAATPNANGLDFSYTATQANASLVGTTIRTVAEEIKSFNHGTVHIP